MEYSENNDMMRSHSHFPKKLIDMGQKRGYSNEKKKRNEKMEKALKNLSMSNEEKILRQ